MESASEKAFPETSTTEELFPTLSAMIFEASYLVAPPSLVTLPALGDAAFISDITLSDITPLPPITVTLSGFNLDNSPFALSLKADFPVSKIGALYFFARGAAQSASGKFSPLHITTSDAVSHPVLLISDEVSYLSFPKILFWSKEYEDSAKTVVENNITVPTINPKIFFTFK